MNNAGEILTFDELRIQNVARARRWHGPETLPWSGADWSNALCGEAGEAANVVKKLRRIETLISARGQKTHVELRRELALELADVVIYADLLAEFYGVDLAEAVVEKFNAVSDKYDFPEKL
jgi:NTP pyrophosphatase (non-canonical NTP hydrolase)